MPLKAPPLRALAARPITTGLGLAAIATTLLSSAGYSIDALTMTPMAMRGEPWRLLTSMLPHLGPIHLLFNVYWLWVLGGAIEERCGTRLTVGLILLTAGASAALEHALFSGGVGLSGVGYGLFGFAWMAARRQVAFQDVVDRGVVQTFLVWFVFCCLTTLTGVFAVANAAHAAGLVVGVFAGVAFSDRRRRALALGATVTLSVVAIALATAPARAFVNLSGLAQDLAGEADAIGTSDPARALELYDLALAREAEQASWHYNRGVMLNRLERHSEAASAFEQALNLQDSVVHREAVAGSHVRRANDAMLAGHPEEAAQELRRAIELAPGSDLADAWRAGLSRLEAGEPPGQPSEDF